MQERAKSEGDSVLRAITDDGSFRVIIAETTETVRAATTAQKATGPLAEAFGDLLTGTLIVREAMAPALRVQGIARAPQQGGVTVVADSHPDGSNRGIVNLAKTEGGAALFEGFGAGSMLQIMRSLPNGSLQQGLVQIPEPGGVSAGLMAYMQESEQVVSMIAVATILEGDEVMAAGGYLVQLLPEAQRGAVAIMTERLADFTASGAAIASTPDALLGELLYGMPFTRLSASPLSFGCACSEMRLIEALSTLPKSDLKDLAAGDEPLEISCDYCAKPYAIATHLLRPLLVGS